jgi:tetratricopeptide (TPR) repeat protein
MHFLLKEKILPVVSRVAGSVGILYTVAALIVIWTGDVRKAGIRRVDNTSAFSTVFQRALKAGQAASRRDLLLGALYYKNLIKAFPSMSGAYGAVGYCYANTGMDRDARFYFDQGLKACPSCFWLSYNAAVMAYKQKKNGVVLGHLQHIVQLSKEKMLQAVVLAPLMRFPPEERQKFYAEAMRFALQVRTAAWKGLVAMSVLQRDTEGFLKASRQALEDPLVEDKIYFVKGLMEQKANNALPKIDTQVLAGVLMHPWAKVIPIGRESQY